MLVVILVVCRPTLHVDIAVVVGLESLGPRWRNFVAVLGAVGLIPLFEVYTVVARCGTDIVSTADVLP